MSRAIESVKDIENDGLAPTTRWLLSTTIIIITQHPICRAAVVVVKKATTMETLSFRFFIVLSPDCDKTIDKSLGMDTA